MPTESRELREYRKAIREAWLPIVGRKKLSSHEYLLTASWHLENIPLSCVLQAIEVTHKNSTKPLYSLGVVRSALRHILRERARMHVGAPQDAEKGDWRKKWAEGLEDIASCEPDPERGAMWRELRDSLPGLTEEETEKRWKELPR